MGLSLQLNRIFVLFALVCIMAITNSVQAADQDLEDKLQRMERLLQQQQEELEAQRRELAEQRALIRQLQEGQQSGLRQAVVSPAGAAPESHIAGVDSAVEAAAEPTEIQAENEPQLAESDLSQGQSNQPTDGSSGQQKALAERARRDAEGVVEEPMTSYLEDPSNILYNPDFPGAWHLPGTTAAMKIGGFVNVSLIHSFDPMRISDRFIVGSIPPEGEDVVGAKAGTVVTASQTRVNLEVREQTGRGSLRMFVEGDFEGDSATFRLRHAFGQYRSALAGQTWSTMMDINSRPEEVDFEGINGEILERQAQLRLSPRFGNSMSFTIALEDPKTDVVNGNGSRGRADIVMSVDRLPFQELERPILGHFGNWNSRVAFILRELEASQPGSDPEQEGTSTATGWGITTSGRKSITYWGEQDFLVWQLTYGKGVGRYVNDLNTIGGGDAVFSPEGELDPLPVLAGYVSYQHQWPKSLRWFKSWPGILRSNLTFSWVDINNFDYQDDKNYNQTLRASANLIYLPTQNFRVGFEFLWGQRKNKDNSKGTATQLQVSARYNF